MVGFPENGFLFSSYNYSLAQLRQRIRYNHGADEAEKRRPCVFHHRRREMIFRSSFGAKLVYTHPSTPRAVWTPAPSKIFARGPPPPAWRRKVSRQGRKRVCGDARPRPSAKCVLAAGHGLDLQADRTSVMIGHGLDLQADRTSVMIEHCLDLPRQNRFGGRTWP